MSGHSGNTHTYRPCEVAQYKAKGNWDKVIESHQWFADTYPNSGKLVVRIYHADPAPHYEYITPE